MRKLPHNYAIRPSVFCSFGECNELPYKQNITNDYFKVMITAHFIINFLLFFLQIISLVVQRKWLNLHSLQYFCLKCYEEKKYVLWYVYGFYWRDVVLRDLSVDFLSSILLYELWFPKLLENEGSTGKQEHQILEPLHPFIAFLLILTGSFFSVGFEGWDEDISDLSHTHAQQALIHALDQPTLAHQGVVSLLPDVAT